MNHVVTVPREPFPIAGGALMVHQVPAAHDNLVWVLHCAETGECAVVDGPAELDAVLALVASLDAKLTTVFNTHTHFDHVGINAALHKRGLLDGMRVVGPGRKASDVPGLTDPVDEGNTVVFGTATAQVWLTEGHMDGHVSFVFDGAVFCGDTLFAGGCGFLFDGPAEKMFRSLLRLAELPGDTWVCCAHEYTEDNLLFARFVEPDNDALLSRIEAVKAIRSEGRCNVPSTIAEETATNPFLRPGSETLIAQVRGHGGLKSVDPSEVFAATRALKNTGAHKAHQL